MKKNRGFTIFEMLVVLAIVTTIAVLVLVQFRQGQRNYALSEAAQNLVANLRQAQTMAVTGVSQSGYTGGGYGIYIQNGTSYYLFFNTAFNVSGCPTGTTISPPIKTITLANNVTIATAGQNVFYAPPAPQTCINNNAANQEASFVLSQSGNTKTIKVLKNGTIELQ